MASIDSENFYRIVTLLVDGGTKVLRKLFLKHVHASGTKDLDKFLLTVQGTIFNLKRNKILHQSQLDVIFPPNNVAADTSQFDLSLLCVLLKNVCKLTQQEFDNIETLRKRRNSVYGHTGEAALTTADFVTFWADVSGAVLALAACCGDVAFVQDVLTFISNTRTCPLDLGTSVEFLKQWFNRDKEIDEKLKSLKQDIQDVIDGVSSNASDLHSLRDDVRTTKDEVSKTSKDVDAIKDRMAHWKLEDPVFLNLKRQTNVMMNNNRECNYVESSYFHECKHMLLNKNIVTLTGKAGEGKTSTAIQLMKTLASEERCVILQQAAQWKHIDPEIVDFVLIDDVFGKHNFERAKFSEWSPYFDVINALILEKKLSVIFTTRSSILKECEDELLDYPVFKHVVSVSSDKFTDEEKMRLLVEMLKIHNRTSLLNSKGNISDCIQQFTSPMGFPYCCKLFCSDDDLFRKGANFFSRPYQYLQQSLLLLSKRNKEQFAVLTSVFFCENAINKKNAMPLKINAELMETLECVSKMFGIEMRKLLTELHIILSKLTNSYLVCVNSVYQFSHNIIQEIVGKLLSEHFPEEVIKRCSLEFLCGNIRIGTFDTSEEDCMIAIEEDNYKVLADRFISEVVTRRPKESQVPVAVALHPAVNNPDFVEMLWRTLEEQKLTEEFLDSRPMGQCLLKFLLLVNPSSAMVTKITTLLYHEHQKGYDPDSCFRCQYLNDVQQLVDEGKTVAIPDQNEENMNVVVVSAKDLIEKVKQNYSLNKDWSSESHVTLQGVQGILLLTGIVPKLQEVVQTKDIGLVTEVVKRSKNNGKFDLTSFDAQSALHMSTSFQTDDILLFLLEMGIVPGKSSAIELTKSRSLAFFKYLIQTMKENGIWDVRGELNAVMLQTAVLSNLPDKCDLLLAEGSICSIQSLLDACKCTNNDCLNLIICNLHSQNLLDPSGESMLQAMKMACRNGNWDACQQLIAQGVVADMGCLQSACEHGDCQCVSVAIQSMKSSGKWEPQHASVLSSLNTTCRWGNYKVCQLLLDAGVEAVGECLVSACKSGNVLCIKKILNNLEARNKWDPKSEYAEKSLAAAVLQNSSGTVSVLSGREVFPTLQCLENACFVRNDELTAQFLTNVLKTHDAEDPQLSQVLNIACKRSFDTGCKMLIENGVLPNSKCIVGAAKKGNTALLRIFISVLQRVRKWNPSDEYITKGLNEACYLSWDRLELSLAVIRAGVKPDSGMLQCLKDSVYFNRFETLVMIVMELKSAGTWNPAHQKVKEAFLCALQRDHMNAFGFLWNNGMSRLDTTECLEVVLKYSEDLFLIQYTAEQVQNAEAYHPEDQVCFLDLHPLFLRGCVRHLGLYRRLVGMYSRYDIITYKELLEFLLDYSEDQCTSIPFADNSPI